MARYGCTITVDTGKMPSSQTNFVWLATHDNFPTASKDGGAQSILNGGGNLRCYTDDTKTTQIPIEVVTFVTGGTPDIQVWGLSPTLNVAGTVYIEADTVAISQPAVGAAFGRNATWVDYVAVTHDGVTDSTGSATPTNANLAVGAAFNGVDSVRFNGTNSRIDITLSTLPYPFALSAWSDFDVLGDTIMGVGDKDVTNRFHRSATSTVSSSFVTQSFDGTIQSADSGVNPSGGFRKCVSIFESATSRFSQVDLSTRVQDTASVSVTGIDRFTIGTEPDSTPFSWLDADALFFKLYGFAPSQDFADSEYNNQSDPSTFWTTSAWADQDAGGRIMGGMVYYGGLAGKGGLVGLGGGLVR